MGTRVQPFLSEMKELSEDIVRNQAHRDEKSKLERNLEGSQVINGLLRVLLQTTLENRIEADNFPEIKLLCKYSSAVQKILESL